MPRMGITVIDTNRGVTTYFYVERFIVRAFYLVVEPEVSEEDIQHYKDTIESGALSYYTA